MATPTELLHRHKPVLKYDSQESYFADSAAEWTDNPGNRLVTAAGQELAVAGHGLGLAFLGPTYPDGTAAQDTDVISDPTREYRSQARALHQRPGYANHVYGHAVPDRNGDLWLQYWFFYFYNDFNLIGRIVHAGLHEGDWEMVQVHLRGETPDLAVYAQHKVAEARDWRQVDLLPGTVRSIVYVARGSHASYFEPGTHFTGAWFDHADGKRRSPEQTLDIVDESPADWAWVHWPGRWGDTKAAGSPIDSDSPDGPGHHRQWDDPLALVTTAREEERRQAPEGPPPIPPPPPRAAAAWHDGRIRVTYEVFPTPDDKWPVGLAVTINSPDEPAPPTTQQFPIAEHAGSVDVTATVDPAHRYDVYVSAATADGLASDSVRADLPPEGQDR